MRFFRDEEGVMALTTIVLLPLLMIVLVGLLELGRVRVIAERGRLAADLATVTAVNDQDEAHLARTGSLRVALDAEEVAREVFAANLDPIGPVLASSPAAVSASADVTVLASAGSADPRTGRIYGGPTVRLAADLPVLTPAFGALLARPVTLVRVVSASSAR